MNPILCDLTVKKSCIYTECVNKNNKRKTLLKK